jgi:hypothetical protein
VARAPIRPTSRSGSAARPPGLMTYGPWSYHPSPSARP